MKRIVTLLLSLTCVAAFAAGCSTKKEANEKLCSLLRAANNGNEVSFENDLGSFSGGTIGPLFYGEDFRTTLSFETHYEGSYIWEVFFQVASKKTRVAGSSLPLAFTNGRRKRSLTVNVPSSLLVSQDGGTFLVHINKTQGTMANREYTFEVPVPLAKRGERVTYDCGNEVHFPSYFYYWKTLNRLAPSPLSFSLSGSEQTRANYKEQNGNSTQYLLLSSPGIVISYPYQAIPSFTAELWLYDHFEDFPRERSGDHIIFPMKRTYSYGGTNHLLSLADTYFYSRRNLAMRKLGESVSGDIQSSALLLPIGKGHVGETYHFVLQISELGLLKNHISIPGTFTRNREHFGNLTVGEYYLSCGSGA